MQFSGDDMKYLIILISFFLIFSFGCSDDNSNPTETPGSEYEIPGYDLVWHDEFDGTTIEAAKWEYEVNADGGGNNELQYYTARPENSFVEDGDLHIVALREEYTGDEGKRFYTSARMRTANRGDWKYGRIEVKAKIPYGQGLMASDLDAAYRLGIRRLALKRRDRYNGTCRLRSGNDSWFGSYGGL